MSGHTPGPVVVSFLEVGRDRLSWKATLCRLDENLMIREIKKRGALGSRGIEITDEDGCGGAIYVGGFRCVGRWRVFAEDQEQAIAKAEGPVMKVCQCRWCGRIRQPDGTWTRDDSVTPDVLGQCALCMDQRHRAHERKRAGEIRRLRQGKTSLEPLPDPFTAIRHDVGDEFWKGE